MKLNMNPTVSYHAMEKATKTLEFFLEIYSQIYNIQFKAGEFFQYFPILAYTESTIYQIDEEYEANISNPSFCSEQENILLDVLNDKGFLDEKIHQEFEKGKIYYNLERKMCSGFNFSYEDIVMANDYKCYDARILHRLMRKLQKQPYNEEIFAAIYYIEILIDLEDDLEQYETDIARNVYNTYRMMVKLFGSTAKKKIQEYIGWLTQQILENLAKPTPKIQKKLSKIWRDGRAAQPPPIIPDPILE